MTNKVEILDAIMSSGKTTAILNWFDNNLNQRYIYVTLVVNSFVTRKERNSCVGMEDSILC